MSDKNARTLTQHSNRAKPKDVKAAKVVFKGVLASPFRIQWPSVPVNLQNNIFAYLSQNLEGASKYHSARCVHSRKRKRVARAIGNLQHKDKKTKIGDINAEESLVEANNIAVSDFTGGVGQAPLPMSVDINLAPDAEPPLLLRHLIYGINEVTKRLETQTENARRPIILTVPEPSLTSPTPLKSIFVCRADVDPALLIDHLPHLVAAHNSTSQLGKSVKLVTLPRGSELALAKILGIRRVTVLAIDKNYPHDQQLTSMLEQVPTITASWLSTTKAMPALVTTHVKHLRTTAPKDMKAAKELRNQGKSDAKKRKLLQKVTLKGSN
ncbi:hypothetical protein GALMADRAFT_234358 [Galerina marginata CBS 339.88]|uniref:Uncharacterized protein n=1 Tax=Galerina marginata (strain CBS 339.88) TaxID=685588 RepID=A0A067TQL2_GALM3|nr:hypothetical protein GALMADRAFT_234358 [Galerina marginata CBS 339.88]